MKMPVARRTASLGFFLEARHTQRIHEAAPSYVRGQQSPASMGKRGAREDPYRAYG